MAWPVTKVEASLARNTAAPAISWGSPMRCKGVWAVTAFRVSGFSHKALAKSVRMRPGAMQLTRTWCGPNSAARMRASWKAAGVDEVAGDLVGAELGGEVAGELEVGGLGNVIGADHGRGLQTADRADDDHRAGFAFDHLGRDHLGEPMVGDDVVLEDLAELVV